MKPASKVICLMMVGAGLTVPHVVSAQTYPLVVSACGNRTLTVTSPATMSQDATGKLCTSAVTSVAVTGVTTTEAAGTITTHAVFQQALASNASRKGCTIQNTSTDVEYVFFGATVSATTANSFALGAASVTGGQGGSINCSIGGLQVATDNIAITSKANDGATFVVSSQ